VHRAPRIRVHQGYTAGLSSSMRNTEKRSMPLDCLHKHRGWVMLHLMKLSRNHCKGCCSCQLLCSASCWPRWIWIAEGPYSQPATQPDALSLPTATPSGFTQGESRALVDDRVQHHQQLVTTVSLTLSVTAGLVFSSASTCCMAVTACPHVKNSFSCCNHITSLSQQWPGEGMGGFS
jgi:hypothetical protein